MRTPPRNNKENMRDSNASTPQKTTPLSGKQEILYLQKVEAAERMREEKERLREEKKRRQEEFLRKTAQRRKKMEAQLEARRSATRHANNIAHVKKEMEIADLRWSLEQERLHRIDQVEEHRKKHKHEEKLKARQRYVRSEAEDRQRMIEEEERRVFRFQLVEDMEHARLVKEMQRMEMMEEHALRAHFRNEARRHAEEQQAEADRLAKESRELDEAAYYDVQDYLRDEKTRRRQSVAFRLAEASEWKDRQDQKRMLDQILERQDREAEVAAYGDMKRYLATEKSTRRQSLQEFLQQESDTRRLEALDREEAGTESVAESQKYEAAMDHQRRLTIANQVYMDEYRKRLMEPPSDDEEEEKETEVDPALLYAQNEIRSAMRMERQLAAELKNKHAVNEQKLEEYRQAISEKYFLCEDPGISVITEEERKRRASVSSRASLGSIEGLPAPPEMAPVLPPRPKMPVSAKEESQHFPQEYGSEHSQQQIEQPEALEKPRKKPSQQPKQKPQQQKQQLTEQQPKQQQQQQQQEQQQKSQQQIPMQQPQPWLQHAYHLEPIPQPPQLPQRKQNLKVERDLREVAAQSAKEKIKQQPRHVEFAADDEDEDDNIERKATKPSARPNSGFDYKPKKSKQEVLSDMLKKQAENLKKGKQSLHKHTKSMHNYLRKISVQFRDRRALH